MPRNGRGHGDARTRNHSGVSMKIRYAAAAIAAGKIKRMDTDGYFSA
jgi:hypothetical protein